MSAGTDWDHSQDIRPHLWRARLPWSEEAGSTEAEESCQLGVGLYSGYHSDQRVSKQPETTGTET